jgi:hypothetical protein
MSAAGERRPVGVAVAGFGWMGRVHAQAAVSITAPNSLHREIGVAMAQAGKHLWIEKPVGLTSHDARAVADS